MTLRVLHLIKGLGPGGAENLLLNQAAASAAGQIATDQAATDQADIEFHVAYLVAWKNHLVEPLESLGWRVHCLDGERPFDVRWLWRLRSLVMRERIDVIHGHSPLVAAWTRLAGLTIPASKRPRTIYTEHNEWDRHRRATRMANRLTLGLEDHVLAVSEGVGSSMSRSDVEVVIHGIDVAAVADQRRHRDAVRAELGISADEIVVGIVANFRREKAYDVLLAAAANVTATDPKVRYVSVGQGPLEAEMRAVHAELGLADRFLILGYRDDATRVMSAFDIFTLASHHEGLPVALMDAIALGLPVVATSVGGIVEATRDWPTELVEPGDADALAAAHLAMVERLAEADALAKGDQFVANRFDSASVARILLDHYRRLARAVET